VVIETKSDDVMLVILIMAVPDKKSMPLHCMHVYFTCNPLDGLRDSLALAYCQILQACNHQFRHVGLLSDVREYAFYSTFISNVCCD
jgi:hypothetical protein